MRFHIDPIDIQKRIQKRNPRREEAIQRAMAKYSAVNPVGVHVLRNMMRELEGVSGD